MGRLAVMAAMAGTRSKRSLLIVMMATTAGVGSCSSASDWLQAHPAGGSLEAVFAQPVPAGFEATGVRREAYLKLIADDVDAFLSCQDEAGAIIDPVSQAERQYSTPAFAMAAATLVQHAGRRDLLDPATRAVTWSLKALVDRRSADGHADFYTPMLVHAYRSLKASVPPAQADTWAALFRQIDPQKTYRADLRKMNWNIVSSSGELLRRHDQLVDPAQRDQQWQYLEDALKGHLEAITSTGLFNDPGAPMAYDAFSRLWLEDVFADSAYDGEHRAVIERALRLGGLSTLLLLSPTGEWPTGGRSAMHNWSDAQIVAICEMNAVYWKRQNQPAIASSFKRAAHLAFQSVARWQRPEGDLWIVKNRARPEARLAYEGYSHHSQYNLLAMAMLSMAYLRADESINESPTPSEVGTYLFDVRDVFHKIAAAAGGYYVLIDTDADPHYNATGLQRVHRAGVGYPALSDTAPADRAYQPASAPKAALALGLEWKRPDGGWNSLANHGGAGRSRVRSTEIHPQTDTAGAIAFQIIYHLDPQDGGSVKVSEEYRVSQAGVDLECAGAGPEKTEYRVSLPVLVSDGADPTHVSVEPAGLSVQSRGSSTIIRFVPDLLASPITLLDPEYVTHSGYVKQGVAALKGPTVRAHIELRQR